MSDLTAWIDKSFLEIKESENYKLLFDKAEVLDEPDSEVVYVTNAKKGIGLVYNRDTNLITSIHFYGNNRMDAMPFTDPLPKNIKLSFTKREIYEALGAPQDSANEQEHVFLGKLNSWDKYFFQNFSLRVEYGGSQQITLLTIGSLKIEDAFKVG